MQKCHLHYQISCRRGFLDWLNLYSYFCVKAEERTCAAQVLTYHNSEAQNKSPHAIAMLQTV